MLGWAHGREKDRSCRREVRVRRSQLPVLVEDLDEVPEVGVLPLAPRPFSLLQDRVDCPMCRGEVGDGDEFLPVEVLARRLRSRRAGEQILLAELVRQMVDAVLDRAVEMPDRRKVRLLGEEISTSQYRQTSLERGDDTPW